MEEPEFNLYDDLDEALIQPLAKDIAKQQAQEEEKLSVENELREGLESLKKEYEELKGSKEQILMNWSMFSIAARAEIERKDVQLKNLQRELDSFIFRRNKFNKPHTAATVDTATQTEDSEKTRSRHKSREDSGESSKSKRRHSKSSRASPEKARSSREKDKSSRHDRHKHSSSKRHESHSSHKKHDQENDKTSSKKSSSDKPRSSDRIDDKELRGRDEKQSRKRVGSKSPNKSGHSREEKRLKYENIKSNGRKRSRDKEDDLRKLVLKRESILGAIETVDLPRQETEPKKAKATGTATRSSSPLASQLFCINSSDSDEVVIIVKADEEKQVSESLPPVQDSVSQDDAEPMDVDKTLETKAEIVTAVVIAGDLVAVEETEPATLSTCDSDEKVERIEIIQTWSESSEKKIEDVHVDIAAINQPSPVLPQISPPVKTSKETTEKLPKEKIKKEMSEERPEEIKEETVTFEVSEVSIEQKHSVVKTSQEDEDDDVSQKPEEVSGTISIPKIVETVEEILQLEEQAHQPNITEQSSKDLLNNEPLVKSETENIETAEESHEPLLLTAQATANESPNSSGSKENSLNHSQQNGKEHKSKRLSYTKDILADGETVVLTISRPARNKKKKPKVSP